MKLDDKIQYLKGVGPKMAEKLLRLGISTVEDLLYYYPRDYVDFTKITPIEAISNSKFLISNQTQNPDDQISNKVTIRGKIINIENKRTSRRRFTVTEAVVGDNTGSIKVVWFNQPFLLKMLPVGREVILHGKITYSFYTREVVMESPERTTSSSIMPIYGETSGLTSAYLRRLISSIQHLVSSIPEWLPKEITNHKSQITNKLQINNFKIPNHKTIKQFNNFELLGIQEALLNIHFPKNAEMLERARKRIAFDELFMISLQANLSKEEIKKERAPAIKSDQKDLTVFMKNLPFELTEDQKKATGQILEDMVGKNQKSKIKDKNYGSHSMAGLNNTVEPMNRLLNGDVGSGKTVVAAMAALLVVRAGYRVAVMCPTSILANQHFETFRKLFEKEKISIGLFTRERKEIESRIMNHESRMKAHNSKYIIHNSDVLIGTQALIQKGIELENLGLVIVDEQHRFGVKQRAVLLNQKSNIKNKNYSERSALGSISNPQNIKFQILNSAQKVKPHFLSMTATPIPRTLHLALFGDLDISVIREKPANRKDIKTRLVEPNNRDKAYEFIRKHLKAGHQCFVICPLIEETEKSQKSNLKNQNYSENFVLGLFEDERKTVKREYEKLQQIFPEFKIAMLHGRLKTKEKDKIMAEFCANKINILVSTSVVEVGVDVPNATIMVIEDAERFGLAQIHQFRGRVGRAEHQSFCFLFSPTMNEKATARLKALEATSDGFKLAEIDLEQRGPGAIFGTEQSGLLDLKMASFSDRELIEQASSAAESIVASDPELKNHPLLKDKAADYLNSKHME